MMGAALEWTRDQSGVKLDEEVLLVCRCKGQHCVVLARYHEFDASEGNTHKHVRRVRNGGRWRNWQLTFDGYELPADLEPVGYARFNPPPGV